MVGLHRGREDAEKKRKKKWDAEEESGPKNKEKKMATEAEKKNKE